LRIVIRGAALAEPRAESTRAVIGGPSRARSCSPEQRTGREHGAVFNDCALALLGTAALFSGDIARPQSRRRDPCTSSLPLVPTWSRTGLQLCSSVL